MYDRLANLSRPLSVICNDQSLSVVYIVKMKIKFHVVFRAKGTQADKTFPLPYSRQKMTLLKPKQSSLGYNEYARIDVRFPVKNDKSAQSH